MAAEISCPVCGNNGWTESERPLVLRELNPEVLRGGGVVATAHFCTRCGYVRLHRKQPDMAS
jgi:predicted nucleic-acid-binding Zn-ribbon protein